MTTAPTISIAVQKSKIAENGEYNLTGDRYCETVDYANSKWEMVELGELIEEKTERVKEKDIQVWSVSNTQGFVNTEEYFEKQVASANTSNYKIINPNYFAYNPSRINVGSIAFNESKNIGCVSPMYVVFEIVDKKLNADYLFKILKSEEADKEINLKSQGAVRKQLRYKDLITIKIPLPPLEVQEQIVAEIEGYQKVIDGAKQVVENWKPSFRIDPSWEMVELGDVAKVQGGFAFKSSDMNKDGNVQVIKIGNVQDRFFDTQKSPSFLNNDFYDKYENYKLFEDDILISMTGTAGKRDYGNVCLVDKEGQFLLNQRVGKIVPTQKILNNYLYILLNQDFVKDNFYASATGGIRQGNISNKQIESIKIPLPPLEVQEQIVAEIEAEQKIVNANKELVEKMEKKIEAKIGEVWGRRNV